MNAERFQVFSQGVKQVFSTCVVLYLLLILRTLLNLSVESGWSGRFSLKKKDELINEVIMMFQSGKKIDPFELADFLMQTMESRFSTIIEDESDLEVSELICEIYSQCSKGDFALVERLMNIKKTPIENCKMQSYILDDNGMNISDIDTDEDENDVNE
ncbi:hypothetical protein RS030_243586 [Cryptosporidium xiaoi]|uniref:Pre-rRNA-processing protein TSR2 homolog n=1 Tax=Cryptosporidium xiaoi TaxID=659607 RepID=A0AAV9Y2W5_9CRYT